MEIIEKDFNSSIEKLLLTDEYLLVGTNNSLHRLSSKNFTFNLQITLSTDPSYHFKVFLLLKNQNFFLCGTVNQGRCQIIDQNFHLIINSSFPIVANDQINSTIALLIPEENLIYFGVTYTNEGISRWQIPNISGRSLNLTNFMKIYSMNNDDESISRDDLSLRFMPRQQTTFIVQYVYSFYTANFIYFLTNQPNDLDQTNFSSKIIRFCRKKSHSIIRSYSELPLLCVNADWILQSAQTILDQNQQSLLIGIFRKRDGSTGTNICSWNLQAIERAFYENYQNCYSSGIGQRGLAFIKPNEPCRKDESWSVGMTNDLCSWIISDRLPYPVGGINPIIGRLFYENSAENTSAFHLHPYGSINLFSQGLTNGTFKLGILQFSLNIHWIYSYQLTTPGPIFSDILFDNQTASFFIASSSKIFRLSFSVDCSSRLSCDECLSSSTNTFCGWCSTNERCTLSNKCPANSWQRETHQCTQIINVQPLNASVDQSQWINLTLSKLPPLEHNEIYQCIFKDNFISASTQAIKLDYNRLSCPTPSNYFQHISIGNESKVRLSVIKFPSNTSIATVSEFTFYNCSSYASCDSCRMVKICQWCSDRCATICTEKSIQQCPSVSLSDPENIFIQSGSSIVIPLKFSYVIELALECRLNGTIFGFIDEQHRCQISKIPELVSKNDQSMELSVYQNNISIGLPIKLILYQCENYDSCEQCQSRRICSWCQGKCSSNQCSNNSPCTSLRIEDFSPKILPIHGETIVRISLNQLINENILEITLADIPCSIIQSKNSIECQSNRSNSSRQGVIKIRFQNSIVLLSKESIEYRPSSIISMNPLIIYEFGGQILHIHGKNLFIGNSQQIFIGNIQCVTIKQTSMDDLTCRVPSMPSGFYNITVRIDKQTILSDASRLQVTPNPVVQDINPLVSFASGGRLVTVRGMYFRSAQSILVEFSSQNWNTKFKIESTEILSSDNGMVSSFTFRTPGIPTASNDFNSFPIDINFSLDFDHLIILSNLIPFHYISDVLLNISSIPPTLFYTGEELKLQVENLTEAASIDDIQLLIACAECKLRTFTSKGITCQPPSQLTTNTQLLLNNRQHQVDCTMYNASIGPIRFRIGYREYLIGYLSYIRSSSLTGRYSVNTIVFLSLASCLLTISLVTLGLCLCIKLRKSKEKLSPIKPNEENERVFWSTTTSAATAGPYYQVYEQIPSSSSHQNTLTRAPLLVCPYHHYKQDYPTLLFKMPMPSLTTLSIEHHQLKKLIFNSDIQFTSTNIRQSMELFYDLLGMTPFSQAFIDQLIVKNCDDLYDYYGYIFRYNPLNLRTFPLTRRIALLKLISTFLLQSKTNLIELFHLFDNLINGLIHLIDHSPCDQLLNRSMNSLSSSTLLILPNFSYQSFDLSINYENLFDIKLPVLDCDTIDQVKEKLIHYLNSYEQISREELDLVLPSINPSLCSHQMPMIKQYSSINSTILCRKKISPRDQDRSLYHLTMETQLINDSNSIEKRLKENKNHLGDFLKNFYGEISKGLKGFHLWEKQMEFANRNQFFQFYIQVISDLIRKLNLLILARSTCPILQSCLHVIADGLEYLFQTKNEIQSQVKILFEEERKDLTNFNVDLFEIPSSAMSDLLSTMDIRSVILDDDTAIHCLFQLYQFYELHSESINQHIGENHVSVLLPVHHLLVQIRQLINLDTMRKNVTII